MQFQFKQNFQQNGTAICIAAVLADKVSCRSLKYVHSFLSLTELYVVTYVHVFLWGGS